MNAPSPDEKPRGLREWLDPAGVTHLRGCHWIAIFEDRLRRRAWWKRIVSSGYRRTVGDYATVVSLLPWIGTYYLLELLDPRVENFALLCWTVLLCFVLREILTWVLNLDGILPWRMHDIIHPGLPSRTIASDLWMAGLTGRDAAITIYSDLRRHHLLLCVVLLALQRPAIIEELDWQQTDSIATSSLWHLMLLYASIAKIGLLHTVLGVLACDCGVRGHILAWRENRHPTWPLILPSVIIMITLSLTWICFMVSLYAGFACASMLEQHIGLGIPQVYFYSASLLLLYTLPLAWFAWFLRKGQSKRLERELCNADASFQEWINRQHEGASGA
jgi:hypothetical protein